MGWGFRRSTTIGGIRFTFSKSGVSTSFGRKGFRLTSGPRGVYVSSSVGGFYYRQRIGGSSRNRANGSRSPAEPQTPDSYATEVYASADIAQLSDISQDEFVNTLNEWTRRGFLQIASIALAVIALAIVAARDASDRALGETAAYGFIGFCLARFVELRRRRFLLVYDLGAAERTRFDGLSATLQDLAASGRFRAVQMVGHHSDWKRHAGATRSLTFAAASLWRRVPPRIVTNLVPWALSIQGMSLYFFPDRVLLWSRGRFAALAYSALDLSMHTSNFVWDESLPHDAQVVGQTWLYVRRDGGPDGRFKGNRQIPILLAGYVELRSATGLEVVLQTTKVSAAARVVQETRKYGEVVRSAVSASADLPPAVRAALATFGLVALSSFAELKQTYRELVQRTHPDKLAPDLRVFAEERMREINGAYELLLKRVDAGGADGGGASGPNAEMQPLLGARPMWRSPEALSVMAATAAALLVFLGARSVPAAAVRTRVAVSTPTPVAPPPPAPLEPPRVPKKRILTACPLRAEPTPSGRQLALLPRATELGLLEMKSGWWRVRTNDGAIGWTGPKCWQPAPKKAASPTKPEATVARPAAQPAPIDPYSDGVVDPFAGSAH